MSIKVDLVAEFNEVTILIEESKNRAYHKVNEELVLLYFNIGRIVSIKVIQGSWGDNTVNALAEHIEQRYPARAGFTRRGLYRMKQFYDTYTSVSFVTPLVTQSGRFDNFNKVVKSCTR